MGENGGMYVSARADYALRALVALAVEGRPMTAEQLAKSQDLPVNYLEAILLDLRRAGLVISRRGPDAGYRFVRPPEQITAADVMRVLDGPLAEVRGLRPEAATYAEATASIQELWIALRASLRSVLENVTVAHLARGRLPARVAKLVADPDAWRPH
jgi:Rrf2 family protein